MKKTSPKNTFDSFGLSPSILSAIKKAGFTTPTAIQQDAIPKIMAGGDVLAGAETGSGKTAAFTLPLLQKLIEKRWNEGRDYSRGNQVRALILVPTRELAIQIREDILELAQDLDPEIRCLSVYGGVKINPQMMAMRGGVDVLISTPGRMLDLARHNALKFNKLQTLVLDEADRLVSSNFEDEIHDVFKLLPNQRQNLLFTATFPESVRKLVRVLLRQPTIINLEHSEEVLIDQHIVTVNHDKKSELLAHLLKENDWKQVLIFCSAKKRCDNIWTKLDKRGITASTLHGDRSQKERIAALSDFKSGKTRILIATDVASRGIDIEELACVINYELPRSPNDYIHRIGRTGRAGTTGQAISLISHHEYDHFRVIEKRNNLDLKREQVPGFEADRKAPPPPRGKIKKKDKKTKLSKKKRARLTDKKTEAKRAKVQSVVDKLYGDDKKVEAAPAPQPYKKTDSYSDRKDKKSSPNPYKKADSYSDGKDKKSSPNPYKKADSYSDGKDKKSSPNPYKKTDSYSDKKDKKPESSTKPYQSKEAKPSSKKSVNADIWKKKD